jgi:protoheme IX farnesyltransferase
MVGNVALIVALTCGVMFLIPAIQLYRTLELKAARTLMFASFIYLPVVQLAYVLDKL